MEIQFVNLQKQYQRIGKEVNAAIARVFKTQLFVLGEELERFEAAFAQYLGTKYVVGVDNGSDGLILSLLALGIGPGDEVITPVNSFISTTFAITEVGATPIFVDIDPDTHQLDIEQVKKKITKKTKVILPVHLYGSPCEIDKLVEITGKQNIFLIEDACQAQGASFEQRKLGTLGVMGIFSFYPGKNLGACGNGGAICTNKKELYLKLCRLRNFGQAEKYNHQIIGQNTKLDDLQAAVLRVKLKYLNEWNAKRNALARIYQEELKEFKMPAVLKRGKSNYHLFVIECNQRDRLRDYLFKKGIRAQIHYPTPIHLQKCYTHLGYKRGNFPIAEKIAKRNLSLPMYPELTQKEIRFITNTIHNFYKKVA